MEFVIIALFACLIFAFSFAVFLLKSRRQGHSPRLHTCSQKGHECRCTGKEPHETCTREKDDSRTQ
jgi:hypothetical protein